MPAIGQSLRFGAILALALATARAGAHPAYLTSADATVERDGRFHVVLRFDLLAFALNDTSERMPDAPMNALLDGPRADLEHRLTEARGRFSRHFHVSADGAETAIGELKFPTADDALAWKAAGRVPRLPVILGVEARGRLPVRARSVAFRFPEIIGTVVLTVERPGREPYTEPVEPGAVSTILPLALGPGDRVPAATAESALRAVGRFVVLGFEHILPRGLDHVLFVLGLFLLGSRLSALLFQVTAFTLAHSVTLALSLYGIVRLPSRVVEPLIALSIVLVAVDNLRSAELRRWRLAVVFGFGLVHGLGFAGALRNLGLPRSEFLQGLIGFNLGVELGQLAVIALAFLAVGWLRHRPAYRRVVVVPASLAIALVAGTWTVQRLAMPW